MARVLVVGASMGGLRAAEQLRACGWRDEVLVVGEEPHMPYNRPPLSKELLRAEAGSPPTVGNAHSNVAFRLRDSVADVRWQLGSRAVACDVEAGRVELDDGASLPFDGLVIATGLRPRRLTLRGPRLDRHVVRTLDDATRLRAALTAGARVVVIGGGFIGCEVAATARGLGCEVVVVETLKAPMGMALGDELGRSLQCHHERHGVRFRLGRAVAAIEADAVDRKRVGSVVLDDGTRIAANIVVEAVGSHPNVEWLEGNGLDLSDGVLCDNWMRVEGRERVVAVGDVARFPNPLFDDVPRRVEHWSIPTDTARRAAMTLKRALRGEDRDNQLFTPVPSFWSDQFDLRIQAVGATALGREIELLEGELPTDGDGFDGGVAVGYLDRGRLTGVATVALPPARVLHYRRELTGPGKVG